MFTVCPKCSLKLVVTAADLRAAQGYVRCGRCSNVFNALVGLSDEQQAVLAREERAAPDHALAPAAEHPSAATHPSSTGNLGAADNPGTGANPGAAFDEASLEFDPATTDVSAIFVEPDADRSDSAATSALGARASAAGPPEHSDPLEHTERHEHSDLIERAERREHSDLVERAEPSDLVEHTEHHEHTERADLDRTDLDLHAEVDQPAEPEEPEERFDFDPRTDLDLDTALDPVTEPARSEHFNPHVDLEATDEFELADLEPLLTGSMPSPAAPAPASGPGPGPASAPEAIPMAAGRDGAADATSGIGPSAAASGEGRADRAATGDEGAAASIEPSVAGGAGPSGETASAADAEVSADVAADGEAGAGADTKADVAANAMATGDAAIPDAGTSGERLAEAGPAEVDALLAQASEAPAAPRRWPHRVLLACSIVLALLLAAQLVNHYRVALAGVAILHAPLTRTYAALGRPITPHWDVKAYEVRQLGAVISPADPGALTVRASIENTAARPQPLPLLRVMVQDRFGNVVAARDIAPRAYLPSAAAGHRWLGAGQRVDAQVALADPGTSVVGFEIDACLADAAGRVACANGSSPVPGRAAR